MKTNFHTHTTRCKHAYGTDEQYVESAIRGGYNVLGFSDHTPWPFTNGFKSRIRMDVHELDGYINSIRTLRDKYSDDIAIKIGLECEYYPQFLPWLKEIKERFELDFLLFGNHFPLKEQHSPYFGNSVRTPADLQLYLDTATAGLECGLFNCMAHPDLFLRGYYKFDEHCERIVRQLCQTAHKCNIPLEYNYSIAFSPDFWKIAMQEHCKVIIGTDAHQHQVLEDAQSYNQAANNLKKLGIQPIFLL